MIVNQHSALQVFSKAIEALANFINNLGAGAPNRKKTLLGSSKIYVEGTPRQTVDSYLSSCSLADCLNDNNN